MFKKTKNWAKRNSSSFFLIAVVILTVGGFVAVFHFTDKKIENDFKEAEPFVENFLRGRNYTNISVFSLESNGGMTLRQKGTYKYYIGHELVFDNHTFMCLVERGSVRYVLFVTVQFIPGGDFKLVRMYAVDFESGKGKIYDLPGVR